LIDRTTEDSEDSEVEINDISGEVVDAAYLIHRKFGPGLLESAYEWLMKVELRARGLDVRTQVPLSLEHRGERIACAYRIDMVVEDCVVVELKAVKQVLPIHTAQLFSHMKLSRKHVGLLLNFHESRMKDGIKRLVW